MGQETFVEQKKRLALSLLSILFGKRANIGIKNTYELLTCRLLLQKLTTVKHKHKQSSKELNV